MNNPNQKSKASAELETEVLYQRLGDTWYAFSIINEDVFMSPISEDKIEEIKRDTYRAPEL